MWGGGEGLTKCKRPGLLTVTYISVRLLFLTFLLSPIPPLHPFLFSLLLSFFSVCFWHVIHGQPFFLSLFYTGRVADLPIIFICSTLRLYIIRFLLFCFILHPSSWITFNHICMPTFVSLVIHVFVLGSLRNSNFHLYIKIVGSLRVLRGHEGGSGPKGLRTSDVNDEHVLDWLKILLCFFRSRWWRPLPLWQLLPRLRVIPVDPTLVTGVDSKQKGWVTSGTRTEI